MIAIVNVNLVTNKMMITCTILYLNIKCLLENISNHEILDAHKAKIDSLNGEKQILLNIIASPRLNILSCGNNVLTKGIGKIKSLFINESHFRTNMIDQILEKASSKL